MSQTADITNPIISANVVESALATSTTYEMPTTAVIATAESPEEKEKAVLKPMPPRVKRAPKHDFKDGRGRVFAHRHDNGGGWVEDTACVAADVYVGPTAQVMNRANIFGNGIRIESKAVVKGSATILKETRLSGFAVVSGKAVVVASTMSGDCHVTGSAEVTHCHMEHAVNISGSAHARACRLIGKILLQDNSVAVSTHMRGFVQLLGNAVAIRSTLEGLVEIVDFGQVLRSAILNFQYSTNYFPSKEYAQKIVRGACFARIAGSSTVQNDSCISAPMALTGRTMFDNCRFSFEYPGFDRSNLFIVRDANGSLPPDVNVIDRKTIHDKKWCNANVNTHDAFERLLNSTEQNSNTGQLRTVRAEELQSPYSLERLTNGRRIVPV